MPFLPNEAWKSTRNDKEYSCSCKQKNGKSRTECKLNKPNSTIDKIQCTNKSGSKFDINQRWENKNRECVCLLDITGTPQIDCKNKEDADCIIKGDKIENIFLSGKISKNI